jgi:CubicO group peptidase (beta-lactamase class C family)
MAVRRVFEDMLEGLVGRVKREFGLPSIVAGVVRGGQAYVRAAGSVAPFRRADKDTVYRLASVSKAFMATCVMLLAERGAIELDKPVVSYLPDFRMADKEAERRITVRDVLSHRSGLSRHDLTLYLRSELTLPQMVGIIGDLDPSWALGERFHYQNHMYALASLLVERVSGMPWGSFVEENIFAPLGMERSYTAHRAYERVDGNFARSRLGIRGVNIPFKTEDTTNCGCAGSISAPMSDLLKWVEVNMNRGGELFSPASADELHGRQTPIKPGEFMPYEVPHVTEQWYGLGWTRERYKGVDLVRHEGSVFGYKSAVGFVPGSDFGYAVLVNQNNAAGAVLAAAYTLVDEGLALEKSDWNAFFRETMASLGERAKKNAGDIFGKTKAVRAPESCFGTYWHPAYGKLRIAGSPAAPRLVFQDIYKIKLCPSAKGEYVFNIPGWACVPCRFRLENGEVAAFEAKMDPDLDKYIRYERQAG